MSRVPAKKLTVRSALLIGISLMGCHEPASVTHPDRAGMEEQRRCSVQAAQVIKKYEEDTGYLTINPQNHLNPQTGVCAVSIYSVTPTGADHNLIEEEIVSDAFEGTVFGRFDERGGKLESCTVLLPSGETKNCKDREEFEKLTRIYVKPGL